MATAWLTKRLGILALAAGLLATAATAGPNADLLRQHLYAGTLQAGEAALSDVAKTGDAEAKAGLGVIRAARALEVLAQGLYRHGATVSSSNLGIARMGLPVPPNPKPEPIDYAKFRGLLQDFAAQLDSAAAALSDAKANEVKIEIDIARIGFDFDGDGKASPAETLGGIANAVAPGMLPPELAAGAKAPLAFAFDKADVIWLNGYVEILGVQADFLLAHDLEGTFNATFHRLFPDSPLPLSQYARTLNPPGMFGDETEIADAITFIHQLNWPVAEPERLANVLQRMKRVTKLSRENFAAILAETDDDREFLPGPKQTPWSESNRVTQEQVNAWMAILVTADLVLDGKLLIPHWRFTKGFDLNKYLTTAKRTDIVLIIAGYGALPFLSDGPVLSQQSFDEANRVFGNDLWFFAFRAN